MLNRIRRRKANTFILIILSGGLGLHNSAAVDHEFGSRSESVLKAPVKSGKSLPSNISSANISHANSSEDRDISLLESMAKSLAPRQSRRFPTPITGAVLTYGGEKSTFIQWGSSGYYDPIRREIGFIGKRSGPNPYHWLVYDENANVWTNNRPVWDTDRYFGHGYDHNAFDAETGTLYFRVFNSRTIRVWDGQWSTLPPWSKRTNSVGGLSWFPGVGLMYNDGMRLLRYSSGVWSEVDYFGGNSYHDISEYNSVANVLIFGSGNSSPLRKMTADLRITAVASPPFNIGSGSRQGVCISDPNSATLIAYQKGSKNWAMYDINSDKWTPLAQSSGDGSEPQLGTPNLAGDSVGRSVIGVPIPKYGVMMFIQYRGAGSRQADVWLYRHS